MNIGNTGTVGAATTLRWLRDAVQRLEYHGKHRVLPLEDVIVPETQDAVTASFQIPGSRGVHGFIVMAAVEFHHEPAGRAGEIDDVVADRILEAALVAPERAVSPGLPDVPLATAPGAAWWAGALGMVRGVTMW